MFLTLVKLKAYFLQTHIQTFFYLVANFKNLNVQTLTITKHRYTPVF